MSRVFIKVTKQTKESKQAGNMHQIRSVQKNYVIQREQHFSSVRMSVGMCCPTNYSNSFTNIHLHFHRVNKRESMFSFFNQNVSICAILYSV